MPISEMRLDLRSLVEYTFASVNECDHILGLVRSVTVSNRTLAHNLAGIGSEHRVPRCTHSIRTGQGKLVNGEIESGSNLVSSRNSSVTHRKISKGVKNKIVRVMLPLYSIHRPCQALSYNLLCYLVGILLARYLHWGIVVSRWYERT